MNNILIVDDSKSIVKGLQILIKNTIDDSECLTASDMKGCKAILKQTQNIACALLDLNLPDAPNGEIVEYVGKFNIPIIVLTGMSDFEDKIDKSHLVDYVIKDGMYSLQHATDIANQIIKNKNIDVLVVDDSKIALEKTAKLLKDYNLNVYKAYNGVEALEVIENNPNINLVYTDYNMPQMDGLELIRQLRRKYKKNQMSIVVVSSASDKKVSSTLLKYGANDFLNKDYTIEEFYARLNVNLEILELFENLEIQYENNRQKEKLINEQNKMISMNDLIKNISHHWRQPLSTISAHAGVVKLDCQFGTINLDKLPAHMEKIEEQTKFLSNTLDTFRDIISQDNEITSVIVQDEIEKAINIEMNNLKNDNIKLEKDINNASTVTLEAAVGNLSGVLMYILRNAHDVLMKKEDGERWIKVILEIGDHILITVEDNGGGIPDNIIKQIFEPYFTTKHQSRGTGLGLHCAYQIVTETLKGKLYVKNTSNGAKFFIEIP